MVTMVMPNTGAPSNGRRIARSMAIPPKNAIRRVAKNAAQKGSPARIIEAAR